MAHLYALTISKIPKLTPNSVSIEFEIPEDKKEYFQFLPGQYITLVHEINEKELRRSYSICSEANKNKLSVGVKKIPNGNFSVFANENLQVGDTLQVLPPEGLFTLPQNYLTASNTYMAFAAGSGITPVLSMIKTVLNQTEGSKFLLAYGNKSVQETMFYDELEALKATFPERFQIAYFFSEESVSDATFGRIERSYVNFLLKNKFASENIHSYYLCGPEGMIFEIKDTLTDKGVSPEAIKFELFTSDSEGDLSEVQEGSTEVTITVDDTTETFVMRQDETILEVAIDKDLDPPYSCQGGICSSCIARLKEGTVTLEKNLILTDSEIEDGLILACQAHPTSAKVVVDFDDV